MTPASQNGFLEHILEPALTSRNVHPEADWNIFSLERDQLILFLFLYLVLCSGITPEGAWRTT